MKFVREFLAVNGDTSSSCPIGISSLDHKFLNQPMELGVLKIPSLTMLDEVLARLRDFIAIQLYLKHPLIGEDVDPPSALSRSDNLPIGLFPNFIIIQCPFVIRSHYL